MAVATRKSGPKASSGGHCRVFIATSLDGFIARKDGSLDWLEWANSGGRQDYGYAQYMRSVDALVMGRKTFETVLKFKQWPYAGKPVFVLSKRPARIPARLKGLAESSGGTPAEVVRALARRGLRHLYVDGGLTIQGFLRAGLIHDMVITRLPVLLGEGVPLFGPLPDDVHLRHVSTRSFANGIVQSRYRVVKGKRR